MRRFVIGDIHGCSKTFKALLKKIDLHPSDELYLLGDYIDRGPRSKQVLKKIIKMMDEGYNLKLLMGNHEEMFLDSLSSQEKYLQWMYNGGLETIKSFKVDHSRDIKKKYIKLFKKMKYYYETKEFIIVHGGLNFKKKKPLEDRTSMPWVRNGEIDKSKIGGKKLIVGHTPVGRSKALESLHTDRIMLDTGCVYKGRFSWYGFLSALELDTMELHSEYNIDF